MGAFKIFWDSDHVDIIAKVHIYLAIPVNLLLWGCLTWALKKSFNKKIRSLPHEMPLTYNQN